MATKPVEFIDSLVAGIITAAYNVLALFAAALAVPFIRRTHRFWPRVIAVEKKLSSLTFLALSIIAAFIVISGIRTPDVVATAAGMRQVSDRWMFYAVVAGIIVAMVVDIFLRAICLFIPRKSGRVSAMYASLLRITVGAMFMFTAATTLIWPPPGLFLVELDFLLFTPRLVAISAASLPLFVIVTKAFRLKRMVAVFATGIVLVCATAWTLAFVSSRIYDYVWSIDWDAPSASPEIFYSDVVLIAAKDSDGVEVEAFLRLEGLASTPVRSSDVSVTCRRENKDDLTVRGLAGQPPIVLAEGRYVPVTVRAGLGEGVTRADLQGLDPSACDLSISGKPAGNFEQTPDPAFQNDDPAVQSDE